MTVLFFGAACFGAGMLLIAVVYSRDRQSHVRLRRAARWAYRVMTDEGVSSGDFGAAVDSLGEALGKKPRT